MLAQGGGIDWERQHLAGMAARACTEQSECDGGGCPWGAALAVRYTLSQLAKIAYPEHLRFNFDAWLSPV